MNNFYVWKHRDKPSYFINAYAMGTFEEALHIPTKELALLIIEPLIQAADTNYSFPLVLVKCEALFVEMSNPTLIELNVPF